jgi:hypothetical protein
VYVGWPPQFDYPHFIFWDAAGPPVARVQDSDTVVTLALDGGTYALAQRAIQTGRTMREIVGSLKAGEPVSYQELIDSGKVVPPIMHPDPAHCMVSGTGLTHLGSAGARDAMHANLQEPADALTDSMKMFRLGLERGKPQQAALARSRNGSIKGTAVLLWLPTVQFQCRRSPWMEVRSQN